MSMLKLKEEYYNLLRVVRQLDIKVTTIFLAVAILQTVSWYYTSRRFFRLNLYQYFSDDPIGGLYEYLYWYIGDFVTLFVISALIINFSFREKLTSYGVSYGDYKTGISLSVIFIFVMVIIIWFVSSLPSFSAAYPQLYLAKERWGVFILFETALLLYIFAWEFLWRGFVLFGLEEKFGYYAVLIQMIPFVILHNGKPELEVFGSILGGILLGILALRTRSMLYGVLVHFSVMFSIDVISALRFRSDDYGTGLDSLINIIENL